MGSRGPGNGNLVSLEALWSDTVEGPGGVMTEGAKVIQVIVTELESRGDGSEGNPYRRVTQYWSFDGYLLAERDPYPVSK